MMKTSRHDVTDFLAQRTLALVGLSRGGKRFGNMALKELRAKGYTVHEHGLAVVHHECVLMFAEPVGWFHRAHRWVWGCLGKLPS